MTTLWDRQFSVLAGKLDRLKPSPDAKPFYDLLAGALIWTDEILDPAELPIGILECLRPVFHYRTTVILGTPKQDYHQYWTEAQRLCPNWPVLDPSRSSGEHRMMCQDMMSAALREIEAVFDG